jgi:hypothetical protein
MRCLPPQPAVDLPDEDHPPIPLNYDGRTFALRSRSELGDCGRQTLFHFRQQGFRLWATYEGDGVRFGSLVAVSDSGGQLQGCYQHLNSSDELRVGRYVGIPELLPKSKIAIREYWESTSGDGQSVLEQLN